MSTLAAFTIAIPPPFYNALFFYIVHFLMYCKFSPSISESYIYIPPPLSPKLYSNKELYIKKSDPFN